MWLVLRLIERYDEQEAFLLPTIPIGTIETLEQGVKYV